MLRGADRTNQLAAHPALGPFRIRLEELKPPRSPEGVPQPVPAAGLETALNEGKADANKKARYLHLPSVREMMAAISVDRELQICAELHLHERNPDSTSWAFAAISCWSSQTKREANGSWTRHAG